MTEDDFLDLSKEIAVEHDNNGSQHSQEWMIFSNEVIKHIEEYVVPQYGDADQDLMKDWTPETLIETAKKYLQRFGRASRPGEELRDLLKAVHCIQKAAKNAHLIP